jgi:branched-chain amino acid transport system permease protein
VAQFGQMILASIFIGCVYALVAVGYTLLFKAGGVLSFAQAALMTLAGFLVGDLGAASTTQRVVAVLIALAGSALVSAAIYYLFIARMATTELFSRAMLTLGVSVIIQAFVIIKWGASIFSIKLTPVSWHSVHIPGLGLAAPIELVGIGLTLVVFALLIVFFRRTRVGLQLRAASDAPSLAVRSRISVVRLYLLAWLLAGVLAAIGGILIGADTSVSTAIQDVGLAAFPAAVAGGFGSVPGALLGGLVIGLTQQACTFYLSPDFAEAAVYIVLLGLLLWRPWGIFGNPVLVRS